METTQSVQIIEQMLRESKKSLHRNSFYFILWAVLLIPAGIAEWYLFGQNGHWIGWPIAGVLGGIISSIYSSREEKRTGVKTAGDRITSFTWGAFMFGLVFVLFYTVTNSLSPTPLILMLAGGATFISGGISKFTPFIIGGILLEIGALLSAFIIAPEYHGLVFSASILLGYLIPGIMLRNSENDKA